MYLELTLKYVGSATSHHRAPTLEPMRSPIASSSWAYTGPGTVVCRDGGGKVGPSMMASRTRKAAGCCASVSVIGYRDSGGPSTRYICATNRSILRLEVFGVLGQLLDKYSVFSQRKQRPSPSLASHCFYCSRYLAR